MGAISTIFNYNNIGGKIKGFVKWYCWISILLIWIAAPIAFLVMAADEFMSSMCWLPILIALVGPVVIWLGSWVLYAFGELVEDTHALRASDAATKVSQAKYEAERKAKQEAEEKRAQEEAERARKAAEEEAAKKEAEEAAKSAVVPGLKCRLCGEPATNLTLCKVRTDAGVGYRSICDAGMETNDAEPQE